MTIESGLLNSAQNCPKSPALIVSQLGIVLLSNHNDDTSLKVFKVDYLDATENELQLLKIALRIVVWGWVLETSL